MVGLIAIALITADFLATALHFPDSQQLGWGWADTLWLIFAGFYYSLSKMAED